MNPMSPMKIHDMIVEAARHQLENSPAAKAIKAAGFEHELNSLVVQIAANAANPIACAFEDAAERSKLTVERAREVVRDSTRVPMARYEIDNDFTLDHALDAIAEIAAQKLAGAVPR